MYRVTAVVLLAIGAQFFLAGSVAAHGDSHEADGHEVRTVDVVEVNGLLDPVLTEMMAETLRGADPATTLAVVFQIDSQGAVVGDDDLAGLANLIVASPVTVSFWIGPAGAEVTGQAAQLVALGDDAAGYGRPQSPHPFPIAADPPDPALPPAGLDEH